MKIKKGDTVQVIAGDWTDRGKRGEVLRADPQDHRVVVSGVNLVKKHQKARGGATGQAPGIIELEAPLDVSNVMLVCPRCGELTRVGHDTDAAGNRSRVCKKCHQSIDQV